MPASTEPKKKKAPKPRCLGCGVEKSKDVILGDLCDIEGNVIAEQRCAECWGDAVVAAFRAKAQG